MLISVRVVAQFLHFLRCLAGVWAREYVYFLVLSLSHPRDLFSLVYFYEGLKWYDDLRLLGWLRIVYLVMIVFLFNWYPYKTSFVFYLGRQSFRVTVIFYWLKFSLFFEFLQLVFSWSSIVYIYFIRNRYLYWFLIFLHFLK